MPASYEEKIGFIGLLNLLKQKNSRNQGVPVAALLPQCPMSTIMHGINTGRIMVTETHAMIRSRLRDTDERRLRRSIIQITQDGLDWLSENKHRDKK